MAQISEALQLNSESQKRPGSVTKYLDVLKQTWREANSISSQKAPSLQCQNQGVSLTTFDDFEDKEDFSENKNL